MCSSPMMESYSLSYVRRSRSNLPSKVGHFIPSYSTKPSWNHANLCAKVVQHMSTYWAILEKVKGSTLKLTRMDDDIYEHLMKDFPEFAPAATIDEDEMKSKEGKERWRKFMMAYEKSIDDFNFGTMLRNNPKVEYSQEDTIFGEK